MSSGGNGNQGERRYSQGVLFRVIQNNSIETTKFLVGSKSLLRAGKEEERGEERRRV